jgi:CRISPR-associated protein Cas5h
MKILVFDLFAPLGHFKVPYTTTSPLTFPIPPKTSLYGILGAILGIDKTSYIEKFNNIDCDVAIRLLNPVQKIHISENLINTKKVEMFARMNSRKAAPHTRIKIEFLKDPAFRIYVTMKDLGVLNDIDKLLGEHKSVYSLSLGLSECIANYTYLGMFDFTHVKNNSEFIKIASVLPADSISDVKDVLVVDPGSKYIRVRLPVKMNPNRELEEIKDFIVEANGHKIKARVKEYINITDLNENIILF